MNITLIYLALATMSATFIGGFFALKYKDKFHVILGFSAGAVIGLAFFDLMPESISLLSKAHNTSFATEIIALGFILYMLLDRIFLDHTHEHDIHDHGHSEHLHTEKKGRGFARASSLVVHSILDGLGIGFGFQISPVIGTLIAVGVLGHDFSDGINTVNSVLKSGVSKKQIFYWLIADSLAPLLGIIITLFVVVPENILGIILALFCGFFLYIGASDLVPESYHNHPKWLTTMMTVLGVVFLFFVIRLIG